MSIEKPTIPPHGSNTPIKKPEKINTEIEKKETMDRLDNLIEFLYKQTKEGNTIEGHKEIEEDILLAEHLKVQCVESAPKFLDYKKEIDRLLTKYELGLLKYEIESQEKMKSQVRQQVEEFFQNWGEIKEGVLWKNGPSAKDITWKWLVDNNWTGANMNNKDSAARNITLLQNIKNNPKSFKKDFIALEGDGKRYRSGKNAIQGPTDIEAIQGPTDIEAIPATASEGKVETIQYK